jgi:inorganic pyrophosphatase
MEFDVVIEIPRGSRNKYEVDHESGLIRLDRTLFTATQYPADYGFVPDTLGEDGDPLDALVCLYEPTFAGCLIPVKPVGLFAMRDDKGGDAKIICVPFHDPYWNHYEEVEDLPLPLRQEIEQFFSIYKDLEGKEVQIEGWRSRADALDEITRARERERAAGGRG